MSVVNKCRGCGSEPQRPGQHLTLLGRRGDVTGLAPSVEHWCSTKCLIRWSVENVPGAHADLRRFLDGAGN